MGDDTASPEDEAPLLNGLYSSGFLVGPVSGLVVGLQLEFAMSEDEDGNRTVDNVILRAANDEGEVSEDLATASALRWMKTATSRWTGHCSRFLLRSRRHRVMWTSSR